MKSVITLFNHTLVNPLVSPQLVILSPIFERSIYVRSIECLFYVQFFFFFLFQKALENFHDKSNSIVMFEKRICKRKFYLTFISSKDEILELVRIYLVKVMTFIHQLITDHKII